MSTEHVIEVLGGVGLFLLGMVILTDGLKSLAGEAVRNALVRFTRTPVSGAFTGMATTALLQSSSATIVAAVGFVGAQLMTYPMALGIIFGANAGTTITGWLVVLLGFKLKLGTLMPPLILVGVGMRLFGNQRIARIGLAIAGFALIFVGIATLQHAMAGIEQHLTPESFPPDTLVGRLQLILIGIVITLVTQSSSAGVAMALAAVYAGAINFPQAAALVIGMDVGTTATAALATIGASASSRRTGLSHVTYNIVTAIGAFILLSPFILLLQTAAPAWFENNPELALVTFHSGFNLLGVIAILPFTRQFAYWMERLVPETDSIYTRALDRQLLREPGVALEVVQASVAELCVASFRKLLQQNGAPVQQQVPSVARLQLALSEVHVYVDHIHLEEGRHPAWQRLIAMMHTLDHVQRLLVRLRETGRANVALVLGDIEEARGLLVQGLESAISRIHAGQFADCQDTIKAALPVITEKTERARDRVMTNVAVGDIDVSDANEQLEAIRWLQRCSEHVARITMHLGSTALQKGA